MTPGNYDDCLNDLRDMCRDLGMPNTVENVMDWIQRQLSFDYYALGESNCEASWRFNLEEYFGMPEIADAREWVAEQLIELRELRRQMSELKELSEDIDLACP